MDSLPVNPSLSRREFLAASTAGAIALGVAEGGAKAGIPTRTLGKTGVTVPVLGLGTAPPGHLPEKEAIALYHACIDAGVTYLDTAPRLGGYANAQKYLAPVLKERRKEVFVVTKCFEPDGDKALALLRENLKELGIEQADLVYAHSLGANEMPPEQVLGKSGVCQALTKAKRDGLTRFVGASGHNRPGRFLQAMKEWDFDVMMNAVSLVSRHIYDFEGTVWPEAAKKEIALVAMKVYGGGASGGTWQSRTPESLRRASFRYALGLPNLAVMVLGMKSPQELRQNLDWLKDYQPLTREELAQLEAPTRDLAKTWGNVYGAVS